MDLELEGLNLSKIQLGEATGWWLSKRTAGDNYFITSLNFTAYIDRTGKVLRQTDDAEIEYAESWESSWELMHIYVRAPKYVVTLADYKGCAIGLLNHIREIGLNKVDRYAKCVERYLENSGDGHPDFPVFLQKKEWVLDGMEKLNFFTTYREV